MRALAGDVSEPIPCVEDGASKARVLQQKYSISSGVSARLAALGPSTTHQPICAWSNAPWR